MIVDDLTLEKKIGSGAFGEVYLTSKKGDTKNKYATKQIERAEVEKGEGLKYLRNEIVILSYLKHPKRRWTIKCLRRLYEKIWKAFP